MANPGKFGRLVVAGGLGVFLVLFYFFNFVDVVRLLAEYFNLDGLQTIIAVIDKATDYQAIASSLGFDNGFMPFLSWRNFQIWTISLVFAGAIVTGITYFVPNRPLKSEPVGLTNSRSSRIYNINIDRFTMLRNYGSHRIWQIVHGIPRNIAESILAASEKHITEHPGADIKRTVLRFRIAAISLIHENVEKTTGRVLGYADKASKLLLLSAAVFIFFGLFHVSDISGSHYYSGMILVSIFLQKIISQLAKHGKYGLCQNIVPKYFVKKYLAGDLSRSRLLDVLLLAPHLGLYKAKECAVIEMYSTKTGAFVRHDVELEELRDTLEAYVSDGAQNELL